MNIHRFPREAWVTTIDQFCLDCINIYFLVPSNLIQIFVPFLEAKFGGISATQEFHSLLCKVMTEIDGS